MGLIKAVGSSFVEQYQDQFREVIKCDDLTQIMLLKRVTTENGVIQDKSRLFVQPGQCAIFTDNGIIKDILVEPGMYFMDSSAPTTFQTNIFKGIGKTFLESMKRIAYQGQEINKQYVYFISLAEKVGQSYSTQTPILYNDPEWGPIEIMATGQYAFKVDNPVNLLTNLIGDTDVYYTGNIIGSIMPFVLSAISAEISKLGVSFDTITQKQDILADELKEHISEKIDDLGIEITKIVVSSIDVNEKVKQAMRERIAIRMKATAVNGKEVDVYAKLNQAEAMKDLANNPSSSGATIMGMKMGDAFGANLTGNMSDNNNNNNN